MIPCSQPSARHINMAGATLSEANAEEEEKKSAAVGRGGDTKGS